MRDIQYSCREIIEIVDSQSHSDVRHQFVVTYNVTWEIDRFNICAIHIYARDQDLLLGQLITEAWSAVCIYYLGKRSFITLAYPTVLASLNHCFNGITGVYKDKRLNLTLALNLHPQRRVIANVRAWPRRLAPSSRVLPSIM